MTTDKSRADGHPGLDEDRNCKYCGRGANVPYCGIRSDCPHNVEQHEAAPIPMLLFCPQCGEQHIDAPEEREHDAGLSTIMRVDWTNPPHRSHLCSSCQCIWRPADVATVGVASIESRGKADTWTAEQGSIADIDLAAQPESAAAAERAAFTEWCARFPEISSVERLRDAWHAARASSPNAAGAEGAKPIAWVRFRSDGGFEGPIMDTDKRMCDVRRKSGAWTPLFLSPAQAAEPMAWMEVTPNATYFWPHSSAKDMDAFQAMRGSMQPLYAAPPPPAPASAPVGLTAEQREAVDFAVKWFDQSVLPDTPYAGYSKVLRALLEGAKQ